MEHSLSIGTVTHADSLSHVAFGSGHEGRQLHSIVVRTHLHQDFLEGVELTALGVDIVLVHLYIKRSHTILCWYTCT